MAATPKEPSPGLKFIYMLFVGLLVATFVGVGIATFYVAPKFPETPTELQYPKTAPVVSTDGTIKETAEEKTVREKYDQDQKTFQAAMNIYARNVFILSLLAAVIILVLSLTVAKSIEVIADGLLLGGTLTLFYGIMRGFETQDNKLRFVAVTVGLLITLLVGYLKFIRPPDVASKK